jgi:ABC-type polysaccharide transport system permease subunit
MEIALWVAGALVTAIPIVIAERRKCRSLRLVYLLAFFFSWTIIGWIVAMGLAVSGESGEYNRQRGFP